MERNEGETAQSYYQRLIAAKQRFIDDIEPLIRKAKQEASVEVNEAEAKRRRDRDAKVAAERAAQKGQVSP